MATANYIVSRALTRLGIRASETSLTADEIQDGLDLLNDMLSEWEDLYSLGFEPIQGVADEVRLPRGAIMAVIEGLAVRIAPEYSRPISQALGVSAGESFKNMLNANVKIGDTDYPSTLPTGSGNDCGYGSSILDNRFFPEKGKTNF